MAPPSDLDLQHLHLPRIMSSNSRSDSSSSQFQTIFDTALKEYSQKTGKDIVTDPITVLQEEAQAFNDFRNGSRKMQLMRKLRPTVNILFVLSREVLGNGIAVSAQIRDIFCIFYGRILMFFL